MARYRYRKRNSSRRIWVAFFLATAAGIWTYGRFVSPVLEGEEPRESASSSLVANNVPSPVPQLTSRRPETADRSPDQGVPEKGEDRQTQPRTDSDAAKRAKSLFSSGMKAIQGEDYLTARSHLSEALQLGLDGQAMIDCRAALARIGTKTIFTGAVTKDDPFVRRYVIQPGDSLSKIAAKYSITAEFLADINGIRDVNRISAGRTIKVVQGPFHVHIDKASFRMDVRLQNTFVKHFAVGLGVDDSTPCGEWLVGTKLTNPTYYPPRGGKIMAADDPANPLGEYWIELKGVSGDALGQQRYGIHGTIEPDSIGRNASHGCVRMHNEDVGELYKLLIPGKSRVTIE